MSIARLMVRAKLVDENNKPISGRRVLLQSFEIGRNTWINLINNPTNNDGEINTAVNRAFTAAPMIQLLSNTQVISEGGLVQYDSTTRVLNIDFGVIEILDNEAYPLIPADANNTLKKQVGGLPKRQNISFTPMLGVLSQPGVLSFKRTEDLKAEILKESATINPSVAATATKFDTSKYQTLLDRVEVDLAQQSISKGILEVNYNKTRAELLIKDEHLVKMRLETQQLREDLERQKQEEIKKLQNTFEKKVADLTKKTSTLEKQLGSETDILSLQRSISAGLENFSKQQSQSGSNLRLGRVQVNVKGLFSGSGDRITLADSRLLENATNAAALSEMVIEYLPEVPEEESSQTNVPDLSGLSESAVARLLRELGFGLDAAYGDPDDPKQFGAGQAFRQSPAAGEKLAKGRKVLVIFAH
ncbi:PASTA domain-containing protein [Nitrincola schmidtii]|uniref:PASTA domain-containing protein n=1 Tax=Nitrincola schmidtii TaxID=1730894 RepID=UPI00124E8458|nr:PASTA domain-containing protein [Nitrincola schmidtii]